MTGGSPTRLVGLLLLVAPRWTERRLADSIALRLLARRVTSSLSDEVGA